jgi:hypothetical protein
VFQRNPFPRLDSNIKLQVYEEHVNQTTNHWFVNYPLGECYEKIVNKPMLCSGTIIGSRKYMIEFLKIYEAEFEFLLNLSNDCARKCNFFLSFFFFFFFYDRIATQNIIQNNIKFFRK